MSQITQVDWIWRDGDFIPWTDAQIHVLSHAVQFGSSIFEGVRFYDTPDGPAIFRLREHLQRMMESIKVYRTEIPYSIDDLISSSCELIKRNGVESGYLRPMVVRGYGAVGMVPFASPVEVYLSCWPWGAYMGDAALEQGVDVRVASWARPAPNTYPAIAKVAGNYLGSQLMKMDAMADGYAEAIALSPNGLVSEGSGQNVFMVRKGVLVTPPVDGSLLAGITRDSIIAIAEDEGLTVEERQIPRELLYLAEELFFSGTAAEVTPIRSVDRITVGSGRRGPITERLQSRFLDTVRGKRPDQFGWLTHVRGHLANPPAEVADVVAEPVDQEAALDVL